MRRTLFPALVALALLNIPFAAGAQVGNECIVAEKMCKTAGQPCACPVALGTLTIVGECAGPSVCGYVGWIPTGITTTGLIAAGIAVPAASMLLSSGGGGSGGGGAPAGSAVQDFAAYGGTYGSQGTADWPTVQQRIITAPEPKPLCTYMEPQCTYPA